jgi:hypothetical protein
MAERNLVNTERLERLERDYLERFTRYSEEQLKRLLYLGGAARWVVDKWSTEQSKPAQVLRYLAARHPGMRQDPERFVTMLERKLGQGEAAKLLRFPIKYGPRSSKPVAPVAPARHLDIHLTWDVDRDRVASQERRPAAREARFEDSSSSSDDGVYSLAGEIRQRPPGSSRPVRDPPPPYIPPPPDPRPPHEVDFGVIPQGTSSAELLGFPPPNFSRHLARWVPIFQHLERQGTTDLLIDLFLNGQRPGSLEWLLQRLLDAGHVTTSGAGCDAEIVRLLEVVDWHGVPPPPLAEPAAAVPRWPSFDRLRQHIVAPALAVAEMERTARKRGRDAEDVATRPAKKPRLKYKQPDVRPAEADEEQSTCCICFTNFINAVFLDCQHMYCCVACAEHLFASPKVESRRCPVCRTPLKQKPLGVFHKGGAK